METTHRTQVVAILFAREQFLYVLLNPLGDLTQTVFVVWFLLYKYALFLFFGKEKAACVIHAA